jgi:hypothetical protein
MDCGLDSYRSVRELWSNGASSFACNHCHKHRPWFYLPSCEISHRRTVTRKLARPPHEPFFLPTLWDSLKSSEREYLDIEDLFREAGKKATADIKSADAEDAEFLDSGRWHTFGGVLHFIGVLVADVLFYGSAFWVGSNWWS